MIWPYIEQWQAICGCKTTCGAQTNFTDLSVWSSVESEQPERKSRVGIRGVGEEAVKAAEGRGGEGGGVG